MDKDGRKAIKKAAARKYSKVTANRLGVFFVVILLAFVGLGVRLFFITRENNDEYTQRILSQSVYNSQPIPARRGDIIDANGTVLAASVENYNLILDTAQILKADESTENHEFAIQTVKAISDLYGLDANEIRKYMDDNPESHYKILKKGVTVEEKARFTVLQDKARAAKASGDYSDTIYQYLTGITFEKYYVRNYPQGSLACDTIGFSRSVGQASYGLEEYYNDILTGTSGRKYGFLSDENNSEVTTIPAVDGNTIILTLDANVQMMVENRIREYAEEYKDNARPGWGANNVGCIVMRADSGEILAMASFPNYDLNDPTDVSILYTDADVARMEEEGTLRDAYDALWKNFCIADTYEPGSVMKPFTVAMGLETGKISGNETYNCTGSLTIADHEIHCHNIYGDGLLNVQGAVAQSCNVALMYMSQAIGRDIFLRYQNIFNLGLKTNIDLAGEARTAELVFTKETLGESELATSSFGQGFNVTMIQMAAGYAALVNGGYYYEPHVVSKILSSGGTVVDNIEPRLIKQVVSDSTSKKILQYCNAVVDEGTGWRAKPAGYKIGGKTGTAETLPRGNGEYVVSFISHAPADDPKIICYVVIDRPNVSVQEDAKYATILSKQILTDILPYLGIPMTEELTEEDKQELSEMDLSILTNREGYRKDEAGNGEANAPDPTIDFDAADTQAEEGDHIP